MHQAPSPNLYFNRHPIRAKSRSWIELIYPCGHTGQIMPLSPVRGIRYMNQRPTAFVWHNPKAMTVTPQLINWINTQFQHIFTKDAFKWQASTYTAPKELQWHLIGLTNS